MHRWGRTRGQRLRGKPETPARIESKSDKMHRRPKQRRDRRVQGAMNKRDLIGVLGCGHGKIPFFQNRDCMSKTWRWGQDRRRVFRGVRVAPSLRGTLERGAFTTMIRTGGDRPWGLPIERIPQKGMADCPPPVRPMQSKIRHGRRSLGHLSVSRRRKGVTKSRKICRGGRLAAVWRCQRNQ